MRLRITLHIYNYDTLTSEMPIDIEVGQTERDTMKDCGSCTFETDLCGADDSILCPYRHCHDCERGKHVDGCEDCDHYDPDTMPLHPSVVTR